MRQESPGSGLVEVKETLQFEREVGGGHDALAYVLQSKILPEFGTASASAHFVGWVCVAVVSPQLQPTGGQQQGWNKPQSKM